MKVGTDGVLLGSWAGQHTHPENIVDIGAGSGLIALMLAQRFESANVDAIEIEKQCAEQCQENIEASPFKNRLKTIHTSIQNLAVNAERTYDLLVSNPPFFIDSFASGNDQRNIARHNNTLRQHELLRAVTDLSHDESTFAIILPVKEGEMFMDKVKEYPWYLTRRVNIKGSPDSKVKRLLLEFCKKPSPTETNQLIVEKQRGTYTDDFIELVKDFYLNP